MLWRFHIPSQTKTCRRCRPGKRANAWPQALELLPTCWDLLKVCVSNAFWPGGSGVLGGLQAGSCTGQGGVGPGTLLPLALPKENVLKLRGQGLPSGRERGGMLPSLGSPWCVEPGGSPSGRFAPIREPRFLVALEQFHPEEQSSFIKPGSHQSSGQPAHTWGLRSQDRTLFLLWKGSDLRRQQFRQDSCSGGLVCHQGGDTWTNQDPSCQRPHRVDSRGHWTSLFSWDLGRAQCPLCACSVPSKDKRRHGFAVWERHLMAQT